MPYLALAVFHFESDRFIGLFAHLPESVLLSTMKSPRRLIELPILLSALSVRFFCSLRDIGAAPLSPSRKRVAMNSISTAIASWNEPRSSSPSASQYSRALDID